MAKSRDSEPNQPPVESEEETWEEEEVSSEEEIEGSESEPEPEPHKTQNFRPAKKPEAPPSKPLSPASPSADEDESESETDSDAPAKKPDPNIKPIATNPMNDVQKSNTTKKSRSKLSSSGPASPAKPIPSAGAKRAATGGVDGESAVVKRSKKKLVAEVDNSEKKSVAQVENSNDDPRKLFQRLWSEEDEIVILKGMIDYSTKKKSDPVAELDVFHESIKKSLHVDVSRSQLQDKIRRLRKKYTNNASKGKEKVFAKSHDQNIYALSEKIWGPEKYGGDNIAGIEHNGTVNETVVKGKRGKNVGQTMPKVEGEASKGEGEEINREDNGLSSYIDSECLGFEDWIAKKRMEFLKEEKSGEMKKKWKELMVQETELRVKKLEWELELTKQVLGVLRS